MNSEKLKIGVIGAGGWGTALAMLLADKGHKVSLWSYEEDVADEINRNHTNSNYLPFVNISKMVEATTDPTDLKHSDLFVMTVPTQYIRTLVSKFNFPFKDKSIVNGAKGIEIKTLFRVSEILADAAGIQNSNFVVLTGPSHAEEVSRKMPTTVVAASENYELAHRVQRIFSNPTFRVYTSDDITGCEIGGALKNVIAIAAGIIDGLGLGDNTKAALITRGLAEMSRLGIAMGANPQTFSGLSGLGDLIVTCDSVHSRNRKVGEQIGKGKTLSDILKEMKMVAEGVHTTESAYNLGLKHGVEIPITTEMHKILFDDLNPATAIDNLMTRQSKREWWW